MQGRHWQQWGLEEAERVLWNIVRSNRSWLAELVTLRKMGKPDSWITLQVRTDGFKAGQVDLLREGPSAPYEGAGKRGTSGNTWPNEALEVSDEPVVVMTPKLMNPRNRWEEKT